MLTGMNYENKTTLYEEAKKFLKKFKGSDGESSTSGLSIKIEPAFLAANEEALLAAGYTKTRVGGHSYGREKGATWKRGRSGQEAAVGGEFQRPDSRRLTGRGGGYQRTDSGSRVTQPSNRERKNINPLGPDGRPLTCKSCGSYRHLLPACPHSWENMAKVNIAGEEHAVLFTGYNNEEIRRLGIDARNCAVLDSACSSTVYGDNWVNSYIESLDKDDKAKVKQSAGQKVWRWNMSEIQGRV